MEIKAELKKPYTPKERCDFIVEQNHRKGYEIRQTDKGLEAWGYSEDEKKARERKQAIDDLDLEFSLNKQELISQFSDALLHEDLEESEAIKSELENLEKTYDEEYQKIIGE